MLALGIVATRLVSFAAALWFTFAVAIVPSSADDAATDLAKAQLGRFYEALAGKADLGDVLGNAFQVMRTDGTRYDRAAYLARHPAYTSYTLSDVKASLAGDVLTVSYFVAVNGQVEGLGRASLGDPRLGQRRGRRRLDVRLGVGQVGLRLGQNRRHELRFGLWRRDHLRRAAAFGELVELLGGQDLDRQRLGRRRLERLRRDAEHGPGQDRDVRGAGRDGAGAWPLHVPQLPCSSSVTSATRRM